MSRTQPRLGAVPRRGILLFELVAAMFVIAIVLGLVTAILARHAAATRSWDRRWWAVQHARNVLERASVVPYARLDAVDWTALDRRAAEALPGGSLRVETTALEGAPAGKRITARVAWTDRPDGAPSTVVLRAWRFERAGVPGGATP